MAERHKKPADTATLAILERNFKRYRWARLSDDKGDQLSLELLLEAGEGGRAWVVTHGHADRLPAPFDADLYITFSQLYNGAGRPASQTLEISYSHLATLPPRCAGPYWIVGDEVRPLTPEEALRP